MQSAWAPFRATLKSVKTATAERHCHVARPCDHVLTGRATILGFQPQLRFGRLKTGVWLLDAPGKSHQALGQDNCNVADCSGICGYLRHSLMYLIFDVHWTSLDISDHLNSFDHNDLQGMVRHGKAW